MKLYSRKQLFDEIKKTGYSISLPTFKNYESQGIIPRPATLIEFPNGKWRFYTQEEVDAIIKVVQVKKRKDPIVSPEDADAFKAE